MTRSGATVHVIVPTIAWSEHLDRCIDTVGDPADVVIVLDGGVSPGRDLTSGARTVVLPTRRGFASACNAGFRALGAVGSSDVVAFLNDDVTMPAGWQAGLEVLRADDVGVVGFRTTGPHGGRPVYPGRESADGWEHASPTLDGCAFAMRAGLFRMLGGFDESFGMYGEETDLFHRVQRTGRRLVEVPVTVWHAGEGTMSRFPLRRAWYGMRSPLRCAVLNESTFGVARAFASLGAHAALPVGVGATSAPHVRRKRSLWWPMRVAMAIGASIVTVGELPWLLSKRRTGPCRGPLLNV